MRRDISKRTRCLGRWLAAATFLAALLAVACGGGGEPSPAAGLRAVASLEVFADLARQVGGDRVEVTALLPAGADPHTYELAPNRVARVAQADVVFINGLGLEASIEDVIRNNASGPVIELSEGLPVIGGEEGGQGNPHLWLDVRLAARYVERVRDAFVEQDPAGRSAYEANASAYLEALGDLDREMETAVQSIPAQNRKLVTFHDAFRYLAERYGLEVIAVVVPSPGQEPSARDLAELTDTLRSQKVPAAFKEPQFDAQVLELAADDVGVHVLDLLSDAYGAGVSSYIEMMRFNIQQLLEGLGGS